MIGDSIVKDYGGCYHRSLEDLHRHVEQLGPAYLNPKCSGGDGRLTKGVIRPADGWLTRFMLMINFSWPHGESEARSY